jgi:hypothetical protein
MFTTVECELRASRSMPRTEKSRSFLPSQAREGINREHGKVRGWTHNNIIKKQRNETTTKKISTRARAKNTINTIQRRAPSRTTITECCLFLYSTTKHWHWFPYNNTNEKMADFASRPEVTVSTMVSFYLSILEPGSLRSFPNSMERFRFWVPYCVWIRKFLRVLIKSRIASGIPSALFFMTAWIRDLKFVLLRALRCWCFLIVTYLCQ